MMLARMNTCRMMRTQQNPEVELYDANSEGSESEEDFPLEHLRKGLNLAEMFHTGKKEPLQGDKKTWRIVSSKKSKILSPRCNISNNFPQTKFWMVLLNRTI